ncbi:MAG TPA: hypothetical protein VKM55_01425 [Candidatus Lokiarchaeia archaeon]|nr:hypothetical protein [Candidatus Lokiarchaeia archaeon]
MYIVEIGLLHHERPLLQVSFYRTDEELNDATIQKIIIGIYSIVPEIFKNQVLKRLIVAKYTIMFQGFDMTHDNLGQETKNLVDPTDLVLAYAIVDLESEKLDRTTIKTIQAKLKQVSQDFKNDFQDTFSGNESTDFHAFEAHVKDIFKDMLLKSTDRFDSLWER